MTSDTHQPFVRFERRVEVPPETVFDTLTKPEQMRIWWGDDAKFDIDLQVGRRWTITRIEDGQEYLATGIYVEIAIFRCSHHAISPVFSDCFSIGSLEIRKPIFPEH